VTTPAQEAERRILAAIDPMRLYSYRTPRSVLEPASLTTSPYSISPLSNASQALLRSPRKTARKISKMPFKVGIQILHIHAPLSHCTDSIGPEFDGLPMDGRKLSRSSHATLKTIKLGLFF
jgi:hypothetical protein